MHNDSTKPLNQKIEQKPTISRFYGKLKGFFVS